MNWKIIKENLQWIAIWWIVSALFMLFFGVNLILHISALILCILVGIIEGYLIYSGQATITHFYIPILPKSIDWPIAMGVPIALIIKAAWMHHVGETITIWWIIPAIIIAWIAAHLCSFERWEGGQT